MQPDVEDKATGSIQLFAFQEFLRLTEKLHPQSDRANQAAEGLSRRRIVIDDNNQWLGLGHAAPSAIGRLN